MSLTTNNDLTHSFIDLEELTDCFDCPFTMSCNQKSFDSRSSVGSTNMQNINKSITETYPNESTYCFFPSSHNVHPSQPAFDHSHHSSHKKSCVNCPLQSYCRTAVEYLSHDHMFDLNRSSEINKLHNVTDQAFANSHVKESDISMEYSNAMNMQQASSFVSHMNHMQDHSNSQSPFNEHDLLFKSENSPFPTDTEADEEISKCPFINAMKEDIVAANVGLSQEQTDGKTARKPKNARKSTHNLIEKRYRCSINEKILQLKDLLATTPDSKTSKSCILRKAVDHILYLRQVNQQLKRDNDTMQKVLHQHGLNLPLAPGYTPVESSTGRKANNIPNQFPYATLAPPSENETVVSDLLLTRSISLDQQGQSSIHKIDESAAFKTQISGQNRNSSSINASVRFTKPGLTLFSIMIGLIVINPCHGVGAVSPNFIESRSVALPCDKISSSFVENMELGNNTWHFLSWVHGTFLFILFYLSFYLISKFLTRVNVNCSNEIFLVEKSKIKTDSRKVLIPIMYKLNNYWLLPYMFFRKWYISAEKLTKPPASMKSHLKPHLGRCYFPAKISPEKSRNIFI